MGASAGCVAERAKIACATLATLLPPAGPHAWAVVLPGLGRRNQVGIFQGVLSDTLG
jgi:hypothetical protein